MLKSDFVVREHMRHSEALARNRAAIRVVESHCARNARVFGSVGRPLIRDFSSMFARFRTADLSISRAHALRAGDYPQPQTDPFDRMLAAQAEIEEPTLVSKGAASRKFGVKLPW